MEIIANDQGNRITPSYVAFTAEGERLIGDAAKNQLTSNPENTVFDAKRLIGREFKDVTVQADIKHFPFNVIERKSKPVINIKIGTEEKFFTPEEISAMVLGKMRDIAVSIAVPLPESICIADVRLGSLSRPQSDARRRYRSRLFQ